MQITKWSYISLSHWLRVKWNRNYVRIHVNITSMKENLIIIIKPSLKKRQIDYKRVNWLQILETKNNSSKKKKEKEKKKKRQLMASFLLQACLLESWRAGQLLLLKMLGLYPWVLPWQEWGKLSKPTHGFGKPPLPWKNPWVQLRSLESQGRPPLGFLSPSQLC